MANSTRQEYDAIIRLYERFHAHPDIYLTVVCVIEIAIFANVLMFFYLREQRMMMMP